MSIKAVLAGMPVADFEAALSWYEGLLGPPADERPMDGLAEWHFPGTGVIQVIQDPERAGKALLTLSADNLADYVATLDERGLGPTSIDDTTSDKVRISTILDLEETGSPSSNNAPDQSSTT